MRWSQEDVDAALKRVARSPAKPARTRHGNVRVEWQGQAFDSKHELRKFKDFEQQRVLGAIRGVIRQVSFRLPGTSRRIRIDFAIVENNGAIRWVDAKGFPTKEWLLKQKVVLDAFGLKIEVC